MGSRTVSLPLQNKREKASLNLIGQKFFCIGESDLRELFLTYFGGEKRGFFSSY
jgi:hypothetical protein